MRYVSTRGEAPVLEFEDVLLQGLAADGGLYVPERWPTLDPDIDADDGYAAVAAAVIRPFVGDGTIADQLGDMASRVYGGFRHPDVAPLRTITDQRHLLELFWGPTLSFKDYALQMVGAMFDLVLSERGTTITVLGATSGDTGSAAIAALAGLGSVEVVILYPEGRVSEVQRRQMTTVPDANVQAVAVRGTFDDCQDMVKAAFSDESLRARHRLAAVNSINWARVMCQAAYYVWTTARIGPLVAAVPTGNFGNVLAAWVAQTMGAPIERLVVGTNANHGMADVIESGRITLGEVQATLAPAMDIQVSSNFERYLFELYGHDGPAVARFMQDLREKGNITLDEMRHALMAGSFSASWSDDAAIEQTIATVRERHGLLIDPHTATGWAAADAHPLPGAPTVVVATAHPAKFPDAVREATGETPSLPDDLGDLFDRPERTETIDPTMHQLAQLLGKQ